MAAPRRSPPSPRRLASWLLAFGGLTVLLSTVGTGITVFHGGRQLGWPSSGGLVTFLLWACLVTLLVMLAGSLFDPRLGVAAILVSLPVVVYEVGLLVTASSRPAWPVVLAIVTFATTAAVAVGSTISLRRLQPD